MEPDEPVLKHRRSDPGIDMHLPLPPKALPKQRRHQNYSEYLMWRLKNSPVRPTLLQRNMIWIRHLIVLLIVLLALGILFLALGYFLWRVMLPASFSVQSPDLNSLLLGGWFIVASVFALGIFLSWLQTVVALFCCGKGLVRTLE
jgi:hypothetical protein